MWTDIKDYLKYALKLYCAFSMLGIGFVLLLAAVMSVVMVGMGLATTGDLRVLWVLPFSPVLAALGRVSIDISFDLFH